MALQVESDRLTAGLIFVTGGCSLRIADLFGTVHAMAAAASYELIVLRPPQRHIVPDKMGTGAAAVTTFFRQPFPFFTKNSSGKAPHSTPYFIFPAFWLFWAFP